MVSVAVGVVAGMRANKRELAEIIGASLPTLDRLVHRYADFPVLERGTNGREWAFDVDAVLAYLRERDDERKRAGAERDELMLQYTLPVIDTAAEQTGAQPLKPTELLALAKVREAQRREAREAGFLVETAAVRQSVGNAVARLNTMLHAAVRQAGRTHNLPDPIVRAISANLAEAQRDFIRQLGDLHTPERQDLLTDAAA